MTSQRSRRREEALYKIRWRRRLRRGLERYTRRLIADSSETPPLGREADDLRKFVSFVTFSRLDRSCVDD